MSCYSFRKIILQCVNFFRVIVLADRICKGAPGWTWYCNANHTTSDRASGIQHTMARQLSCDNSRLVTEKHRIIIDIENYSNLPHDIESWVQHRWVVRFFAEFIVAWKWRAKNLYMINGALNYKWSTRKLQNSLPLNRTKVLCVFVCICKYTASINAIFIIQSEI